MSRLLFSTRFHTFFSALPLIGAVLFAVGCDTRVNESPIEIVELRAERSFQSVGGDPDDWLIEGSCIGMGNCYAKAFAATFPGEEIARSTYTVRDSRAFPKTPDGILEAAEAAVEGNCFDRTSTSAQLRKCLTGS